MHVDHRGGHVGMAEQFLDDADVVTGLEQGGGERVPQRVGRGRLGETGGADGDRELSLDQAFVDVRTQALAALGVRAHAGAGEHPLQGPLDRVSDVAAEGEGRGNRNETGSCTNVGLVLGSDTFEMVMLANGWLAGSV